MATDHQAWLDKFNTFEASLNGQASQPIHQIRKSAIADFKELSLPTSADEAWKTVNTSALTQTDFSLPLSYKSGSISQDELHPYLLEDTIQFVFINGHFAADLSDVSSLPDGVLVSNLADSFNDNANHLDDLLGSFVGPEQRTFTALNTAFLQDGAYIHVSKNTVCKRPIHLLFFAKPEDTPIVSHMRNLIVAEDNSEVSIIETYAGTTDQTYLTNSVTEFVAGNNTHIDHYKLELETYHGVHVSNQHAKIGRSSNVTSHGFSIGGSFVRNDISAHLAGEGCEATINGLYLLEGNQHIDNYTLLEHAEPNCPSHELYKGILGDQSRAIFRGKIHVHQKAQKTDAYQQNENILLSDNARVNTKPQLEIYADDVKCSHGATIGQLNEDALFYLQARGISKTESKSMLLKAFADDIANRIKIESLRQHVEKLIQDKFVRLYNTKENA